MSEAGEDAGMEDTTQDDWSLIPIFFQAIACNKAALKVLWTVFNKPHMQQARNVVLVIVQLDELYIDIYIYICITTM